MDGVHGPDLILVRILRFWERFVFGPEPDHSAQEMVHSELCLRESHLQVMMVNFHLKEDDLEGFVQGPTYPQKGW